MKNKLSKDDLHQARQIGGLKSQVKFLHGELRKSGIVINVILLLMIVTCLTVIGMATR